jgi:hypothetical protein
MTNGGTDRFDERLREAARDYHTPPPTPRDEMWAEIAARRAADRRRVVRPWMRWGMGVAAVLLLGMAIGRFTAPRVAAPLGPEQVADQGAVPEGAVYQVAARQYLSRAEVFLTDFRAERTGGSVDSSFAAAARELLTSTRLMLDSPAGQDPRLRSLLEDLELILAQIAQFDRGDTQLIEQGLEQRGVLLRLRAEIPAGPATAAGPGGGAL